jgi:dTDP-4-dehydrorhamnose 3,5-epimerase
VQAVADVEARATAVDGCYELRLDPKADDRGDFVKAFRAGAFAELGLAFAVREIFWSRSRTGVVRGLHFQAPPADVAKLVCCLEGDAFDVVVDLRVGSPTCGRHAVVVLSPEEANAVFVPEGCAHGFLVTRGDALVLYAQSGEWDPVHEGGVLWSSVDAGWPVTPRDVVVSERDAAFPPLDRFESPFVAPAAPDR